MTFKGLEYPIDFEEQQLTTLKRIGFIAVEWGVIHLDGLIVNDWVAESILNSRDSASLK